MKRLNGVTSSFLALALLLSAANGVLVFFVHIPVNARLRPRTYFQAYGAAELLLAGIGLVATALVAFLLSRRGKNDRPEAGRYAWAVSTAALAVGIFGLVTLPRYMFLVGILLIGACLSFSARRTTVQGPDLPPVSRTATVSR